ncbi:hypothetical protein NL676_005659 [Syzygium grande]|nr:hypothetical protein NL676_005659 [Syzygium grande]
MGKRRRALAVIVCLWSLISLSGAARLSSGSKQTLEVRKHLRRLNKPAVKSIKSPDGDVIDCVPISDQPAFDHPYLKDHKIQMRPKYYPEGLFDEDKVATSAKERANPINQLWHVNGKCPENTIPVRRTKEDDVLRASSVKRYGRKKSRSIPQPRSADPNLINESVHEYAILYALNDSFYGAQATINVWQPKIQLSDEFSLSQLWLYGGPTGDHLNTIEAGWQVYPDLYGDNNTRLFTYWTRDGYNTTGCYNLLCSGFVQINSEIAIGGTISPVSSYQNSQYNISILIWKDQNEGDWWLKFNNYDLGYWPSSLFSYLANGSALGDRVGR